MAIVRVRKPPRRPAAVTAGLPPGQQRMAAAAVPTRVQARAQQQAQFKPVQVNFARMGTNPKTTLPGRAPGYRQQSQQFPNAPGLPVEFNPNANLNTVQGNIDAGYMQWTPGLGKLGYKPPPRAPGSLNIPGYNPDLSGAVAGDWELAAAQADIEAANAADEAAARENINALAVGWGGDLSDLVRQGLIDQGAAEAAKANQFSQMAELGRQLSQGQGRAQSQLAARGILSSGALPGIESELNRSYQGETQRGLQELMGNIRNVRSSQAQARAERQGGLANVRANVAARLSQMEAYQPIPNMQAFWDPQVQAYVDDWGRRFDRQGKRLS